MVVIDAHCHLSQRWKPTGPATLLIDDMDAAGVDKAVVFGVFGDAEDNAFVAKSAEEHPDRFIPFVNFDPSYEEIGLELVEKYLGEHKWKRVKVGESETMGRETFYNGLNQLAYKFPEVRLVVNTFWPRIKELMRAHGNIIIDTGGRNGITSGVGLVKDLEPTRICFGSESPQSHPGLGVKEIRTLKQAPVYRELLLGKNAKRIFRDLF